MTVDELAAALDRATRWIDIYRRSVWFYRQRANPDGFPWERQYHRMLRESEAALARHRRERARLRARLRRAQKRV